MTKALLFFIWFLCLMAVWTICGNFISALDTLLVIIGLVIGMAFVFVSVKTKCLTVWGK